MSDPRPVPLTLLAKRLHLPVLELHEAVYALGRHWGMDRVAAGYADGMVVTPAAVVAIRQHFGIGDIPQVRGRTAVAS